MASAKRQLYRKLSAHLSESFLDDGDGSTHSAHHTNLLAVTPTSPQIPKRFARNGNHAGPSKEQRRPIVSFIVVYTMIFFNGCCFTAVVPSVPFYLQVLQAPPTFLGWVVSFYSLGQIFGSPLGGWLSNKVSSKLLLTISSTLGFISSAMYSTAPGYYFILVSRLLTGVSAGMEFTTELTFIARNTSKKERTVYLASVTAVNVVGFILGPALGGLLATLDINILGLKIDQYTGPGWLLAVMFILDIIMVQCFFEDHGLDENKESESSEQAGLLEKKGQSDASYGGISKASKVLRESQRPPSLSLVLSLIFVQFTVMCAWSVLETITSPLAQAQFDWGVKECNLLFTGGGFISLIAYVIFVVASKWVQDRWLIIYALVLCLFGQMLAIDWQQLDWSPQWLTSMLPPYVDRFLTGYMIMNAGFMTGRPVTFALYSKLIGSEFQGKYLGWMVAGGSAARTLGPFAAVAIYYNIKSVGLNLLALFGSVGLFHVACVVLVIYQWKRLLPARLQMSIRAATTDAEVGACCDDEADSAFDRLSSQNGGRTSIRDGSIRSLVQETI